jgi:Type IV secretion system pilin
MFKKIITFLCLSIAVVAYFPILSTNAGILELNQNNNNDLNLRVGSYKTVGNQLSKNQPLNDFGHDQFYYISGGWERSLYYSLVKIAKDFKNFMFAIATIFFFVITLRLLLAGNTEEELGKYKKWIIWITIGLVVMQIAYSFVVSIYDQGVSAGVAYRLLDYVVNPLIRLLETIASVFFLWIAIFAFYRLVTSQGDEEKINSAKKSMIEAIIWFLIIKFARALVEATYGTINCTQILWGLITIDNANCIKTADLKGFAGIIIQVINWANSFIALVVVLLIIYAGFEIMTSGGDEEKIKKWKNTFIYIAIGLFVLASSYLILTFFILPQVKI